VPTAEWAVGFEEEEQDQTGKKRSRER